MGIKKKYCFTHPGGEDIYLFTLSNARGTVVCISNYGAIISSFTVSETSIVLGFSDMQDYLSADYLSAYPYFGCIVGRCTNRINNAAFIMDDKTYAISKNKDNDHLHGGFEGFGKKVWEVFAFTSHPFPSCTFQYKSRDGEEGYPGNLLVQVKFILNDYDELLIETSAVTDKTTPVNLTHHDYFNLNGEGTINDHCVKINAAYYLGQNKNLVADGRLVPVENTAFDFRNFKSIGKDQDADTGYDQSFVIEQQNQDMRLCAECAGDKSKLHLQVFSTDPVVHFYTGKWIPRLVRNDKSLFGPYSGLCFETHKHPNAVNVPHFANTILRPGEKYHQKCTYKIIQELK